MITATRRKNETEVRFKGKAEEIQIEMIAVLANGVISTSEKENEEDIESNFISVVLSAMDMLEEKGIKIDTELFKRILDVGSKIDIDKVVDAIGMIMGAIKGEEPDGK